MTAKELADFLVLAGGGGNAWLMGPVRGRFRRPLFKRSDVFIFTRVAGDDQQLLLQVIEKGSTDPAGLPLNVLGEPQLRLTFADPNSTDPDFDLTAGFVAEAYGRKIAFGRTGDSLAYEGQYLGAPHGTPDEGGEGDPTVYP